MLMPFKQTRLKKDEEYLKKHPVFNITGGLDYRLPPIEIDDRSWPNAKNVYVKEKKVASRGGYETLGGNLPLDGIIVGFDQFFTYEAEIYLFCFTTTNIYYYNSSTKMWELVTYNAEIQDCEDKDDWTTSANITLTDDTTNRVKGTNALKVAVGASFTTGIAAYDDFTSASYAAYTNLHLWIKSSVATSAGDIQILLDDTSGCASPLETLDIPALVANTLTEVQVVLSSPALLTAVISVGINIATDLGAMNIYIDDIRASKIFTGSATDQFSTEMLYNDNTSKINFIASNRTDNIQVFVPGTSECWEDLGGSPNKSLIVKNFANHLVKFDCNVAGTRFPQRVEWAVQGNPADITGSGSGSNVLSKSSDWIKSVEIIKNTLAIIKQESITLQHYVGGTNPFEFEEQKIDGVGGIARNTLKSINGDALAFLGNDLKVHVFDGISVRTVSDRIIDKLEDSIDSEQFDICHAQVVDELNLYLLFVPKVGSTYPDAIWVWNYVENHWTYWEFEDNITATGFFTTITGTTIGELLGKIGTLDWRLGSRALQSTFPDVVLGDENGYVYTWASQKTNDNGTAIDAYFDTKSFILNEVGKYARYEYLSVYGFGDSVDIFISLNGGDTWVSKGTIELHETILRNNFLNGLKATSEQVMFRLQNNTLDERFEIAGLSIGYVDKGDIKAQDVFSATHIGGPSDENKYMKKVDYDEDENDIVDDVDTADGGTW